MYVTILLGLIFLGSMAFLFNNGLWTNAIALVNVVTAGLLAMNFFEPLAGWLDKQAPSYTYYCDFLSLWLVFAVAVAIMRTLTELVSRVKVKFVKPVDKTGGILLALVVSYVLVCFTTATLHTAPLARNFFGGDFQPKPESRMFFGLAPDHGWLGFVQNVSLGPFYRRGPKNDPAAHEFDPSSEFIQKYAERRHQDELIIPR